MSDHTDILIIDDQVPDLRLLTDLLDKEGYQVRPIDKPQMAVESAMRKPPGLILLNVRIPGIDGFELCQHLKKDKRTQHVPVVFISALNDSEAMVHGFEAGAVDFISKPFQKLEILARVQTHMRLHEMQQKLEQLADQQSYDLVQSKSILEQNILALKKSEDRFRSFVENANETILVAQNNFVKYSNHKIEELTGYSVEEIALQTFDKLIHPDDLNIVLSQYQLRLSGEQPANSYSIRIVTREGQIKYVIVNAALFSWDDKPATLAMLTDITKLKLAENELKKSEERFRHLMEQSPLAMEILSPDGTIITINSAWRRLWNVTEEEAADALDKYNMLTDPQIKKLGIMDKVKQAFEGKHIILPPIHYDAGETRDDFDIKASQATKSPWIQCHLNSILDVDGKIVYVVNTYVDITDLRAAEEEATQQRESLSRMDRTTRMGQLTGSIGHELNQPLTGILSNAQAAEMLLKKDSGKNKDLGEILSAIVSDTKRASSVIRNLRDMYREHHIETSPFDVNEIVDQTIQLLNSEFISHSLTVTTDLASSMPTVEGNIVQIQQVLVNLSTNAIQAMGNLKKADRRLHIVSAFQKNEIKVLVEDSGQGIDPDKIDSIFEPLVTWKPGGTGMGLSVSSSIIEAHGGKMWAENLSKIGCRVGFTLPVNIEKHKT